MLATGSLSEPHSFAREPSDSVRILCRTPSNGRVKYRLNCPARLVFLSSTHNSEPINERRIRAPSNRSDGMRGPRSETTPPLRYGLYTIPNPSACSAPSLGLCRALRLFLPVLFPCSFQEIVYNPMTTLRPSTKSYITLRTSTSLISISSPRS